MHTSTTMGIFSPAWGPPPPAGESPARSMSMATAPRANNWRANNGLFVRFGRAFGCYISVFDRATHMSGRGTDHVRDLRRSARYAQLLISRDPGTSIDTPLLHALDLPSVQIRRRRDIHASAPTHGGQIVFSTAHAHSRTIRELPGRVGKASRNIRTRRFLRVVTHFRVKRPRPR